MTTTHDDITGVSKCAAKKTSIDITDKPLFTLLASKYPDAAEFLRQHRGGETLHIPASKDKREAARRFDDGSRTVEEVARLAGCSERTVRYARRGE